MQFFKRAALLISGLAASVAVSKTSEAQEESWISFLRDDTPSGWIITVDQTTTSGQRGEPKYCARLSYEFDPSQLADNGMPKGELSEHYYELEDRICTQQSKIGCRMVASKAGVGQRYVWFCANESSIFPDSAKVAERFTEFRTSVVPATFAELRSLNPTTLESQIAQNRNLLDALSKEGDVAERPRKIMHWIYGLTSATANEITKGLTKLGYTIEEISGDKITFFRLGRIDLREFNDEVRKLNGFCADFGCMYDGWETAVVRE